ncbi:MAG: helix-turn-helix transcriptional regulator [Bacteroidota bacterium]
MIFSSLEERYQDADFWTGKLQLELFRLIRQHLEETGMSQNAFAREIGVSKGYLSQVLNGNFDHKLSKLVSLALAVGKLPVINYEDVDKVIKQARGQYEPLYSAFVSPPTEVVFDVQQVTTSNLQNDTPDSNIIFKDVA